MELVLFWTSFVGISILYFLFRRVSGRPALYLPDALVLATGSHTIGALFLLAKNETVATQFIASAAFLSFTAVATFTLLILALTRPHKPHRNSTYFKSGTIYSAALVLVTLSNLGILAILMLNPAIGALIIASFTATDDTNLLAVRKAITASTEGYMSPGLIKLIRDIISPIVLVSFVLSRPKASRSILFWLATICTLASILVGGQRFPMLLILVALVLGFIGRRGIEGQKFKLGLGEILKYGGGILFLFYLMSALLGRTEERASALEAAWWSLNSLVVRIFSIVPHEAEKTFAFWSKVGPTWGQSWLSDLAILLPGAATSSLSSQLHEAGGGSAQGNAPLFFAIDSWLAFGWFGIPIACLLFLIMLHMIDTTLWTYRSPGNDSARIVLYLNVPLMYSPFLFLLYGGLIVLPIVAWTLVTRGELRLGVRPKRIRRTA